LLLLLEISLCRLLVSEIKLRQGGIR
jgi:hypothetical protein